MKENEQGSLKFFNGKTEKLQNLCHSITDCDHSTPEWTETGKIVVRNFNIKGGRLLLDKPFFTSEKTFLKRTARSKPKAGDLIITREAPMGEVCVIPEGLECCLGQRMVLIKPDLEKVNSLYLLYAIQSEFVQKQIKQSEKTGSIVSNLRIPDLKDILIPVTKHQQKIAAILSALDSKIEFNNRINSELEAMAKTLYDYWFVQFDFPDKDGKPYKTSGGKMVWNAELKRDIPDGWKIKNLDDVISRSATGLNPRDNFKLGFGENYYITIKNVKNGRIIFDEKCDRIDDMALEVIDNRSNLQVGDILFTSIEPVGITYFIHDKPTNWNINESVFTLRANYERITSEYLYMLLSSTEMKAFTKNISTGSIHKGVRHSVLKTFKLPYKDKEITERLSLTITPVLKRINVIEKENQTLSELRDWLLPMLMNGQVTVKSVEA